MRPAVVVVLALAAAACRRYADFVLPEPAGAATEVRWQWEPRRGPVLSRGDWDSSDALNPSIVRRNGRYWNFYSGFDGKTWHTGLATSADGLHWERHGRVLSPAPDSWEGDYIAANGSVLAVNGEFWLWYQAGAPPRIGLARSSDGRAWTKHPVPVLDVGPRGSWDERGVGDPYVLRRQGRFYLFFLGQDRARRQRLGVATSPDGVTWWKLRTNPVLELGQDGEFDENGLGEPAVWTAYGSYWMLYTGRDRREYRRMGLARSTDGVRWLRVPGFAAIGGTEPWNEKVVCDAEVEVTPQGVRVWFGGGDQPRPDERVNGQIGFGWLRPGK